jgi:hypothetical protein
LSLGWRSIHIDKTFLPFIFLLIFGFRFQIKSSCS